jgi:hypothetical protein
MLNELPSIVSPAAGMAGVLNIISALALPITVIFISACCSLTQIYDFRKTIKRQVNLFAQYFEPVDVS